MLVYMGKCSDPLCDSYNFCDVGICLNLRNRSYFKSEKMFSVICCTFKFQGIVIL